ncbi:uncharacterized protein LOC110027939 [Phalaenopsis equestris]|uniref:uncharacterized protein LOC110027939 n=1 Tax=Phalaenopsis equestris TaxID=78828 RepID=UPI0009E1A3E1|nr:uncharacterized protein LOC110027939 [Phalaenopsis equestris]
MATVRLPLPWPPVPPLISLRPPSQSLTNVLANSRSRKILVSSSSSLLRDSVPIVAQHSSPSTDDTVFPESDVADGIKGKSDFRGCKACGRKEIEKGCNGEGRIQGGIATIRGFDWWPIKAFRPCPGFVASGGSYKRYGQTLDEVAFGRDERDNSVKSKMENITEDYNNIPTSELSEGLFGKRKREGGPKRKKRMLNEAIFWCFSWDTDHGHGFVVCDFRFNFSVS